MIVDLFAGPGGWDEALRMLGVTDVEGIEWDEAACATAEAAGHRRTRGDIAAIDPRPYRGATGLIGSPPCPGFSPAGLGLGRKDLQLLTDGIELIGTGFDVDSVIDGVRARQHDARSALTLEPLRWALAIGPRWIALEQVPAVLPLWEAYATLLRSRGYSVWTGNLKAERYGVGQTRTRAGLLASLDVEVAEPVPTHSAYHRNGKLDEGVQKWVSMADAVGWGLVQRPSCSVAAGGSRGSHSGGEWGGESVRKVLREERDSGDPARWRVRSSMGAPKVDGRNGSHEFDPFDRPAHTVTTKVGEWVVTPPPEAPAWTHNRPSYTVTGGGTGTGGAEPFGNGARQQMAKAGGVVRVTVQEAALLQSFPADYPWQGALGKRFQQVGNAVPPLMGAHVLSALGVGQMPKEIAA